MANTRARDFGAWLADLREKAGAGTQESAAMRIGISRAQLARWETGTSMPDISRIGAISSAYNVSVEEVLSRMGTEVSGTYSPWALSLARRLDQRVQHLPTGRRKALEQAIDAMISAASGA